MSDNNKSSLGFGILILVITASFAAVVIGTELLDNENTSKILIATIAVGAGLVCVAVQAAANAIVTAIRGDREAEQ